MNPEVKTYKGPATRTQSSPRYRFALDCSKDKPATKQSFADSCDVNKILARYQKTGALDHVAKHQPTYGFATDIQFHEAMNIVATATSMFEDLPSSIRTKFNNEPGEFLAFVQDPDNADELVELGLANAALATPSKKGEKPATDASDVPPADTKADPPPKPKTEAK